MVTNISTHFQILGPGNYSLFIAKMENTQPVFLHPLEKACLGPRATLKRRQEFCLGRKAAHRALEQIGINSSFAILKGKNRQPIWPEKVVGSITHKAGIAIAVVALKSQCRGIGIDLEKCVHHADMPFYKHIGREEELEWILDIPKKQRLRLSMLFSAKEALYKMLNPLVGAFLGFKDVCLSWNSVTQSFTAVLRKKVGTQFKEGDSFTVFSSLYENFVFSSVFIYPNQ